MGRERWEIRYKNNDGKIESIVFTAIWKVSDFERSLREQGIEYKTTYFEGDNEWRRNQ